MVPMRKDMLPATFFPPFDRLLPAAESRHVGRLIKSSEAVRISCCSVVFGPFPAHLRSILRSKR